MATFNKFNCFVEDLAEGKHNLGSDVLKALLTNSAPSASNTVKSNLTEISAGNGYPAGGATLDVTSSAQSGGVYDLVMTDEVITAAGGSIGPFRYVAIYNDTHASKPLIGWYDYGSSVTLSDTEPFTIDFGAYVLRLS